MIFAVFDPWLLTQITKKTTDKLQFLSFIFAALLSVTAHFIALRLGRANMHHHTKILLR